MRTHTRPPASHRRIGRGAVLLLGALLITVAALAVALWARLDTVPLVARETADQQPVYLFVGADSGIDRNPLELQYTDPGDAAPSRADALILVRVRDDGTATVVPVPRDLLVPRESGAHSRLALRLLDGPQAVVDGVCGSLGVAVTRYVSVDGAGFTAAIDALGGIETDVPFSVRDSRADLELAAGEQTLDGADALALVRSRHPEQLKDGAWVPASDGATTRTEWSGVLLEGGRARLRAADPLTLTRTVWQVSDDLTVGGGLHVPELLSLATARLEQTPLPVEPLEGSEALLVDDTAGPALRAAGFTTDCTYP